MPATGLEMTHTIVVGASAAGLAVSCCLKQAGIEHVLLEKEREVGTAWRNHYDRLHLHTTKGLSALPHMPWPRDAESYPPREEVVRYLERYQEHFDLQPRFGESVERIENVEGHWEVETRSAAYEAKNVVIATGYTRKPHVPRWPGQDDYQGEVLHSSRYRNGDPWKGKRVLVVGFGNSACEIAIDLHERGVSPTIAVRSPVNIIPRDVAGIPILGVGIAMSVLPARLADIAARPLIAATIGSLKKLGLEPLPYGPNEQIQAHGRIPLLDIGTVRLIREGHLVVRKGIDRFTGSGVVFTDGVEEDFDAVVLGTGYRPALDEFLVAPAGVCGPDGNPLRSGHQTAPGLYFCGFYVSPTGMLREIRIEAERIADEIQRSSK